MGFLHFGKSDLNSLLDVCPKLLNFKCTDCLWIWMSLAPALSTVCKTNRGSNDLSNTLVCGYDYPGPAGADLRALPSAPVNLSHWHKVTNRFRYGSIASYNSNGLKASTALFPSIYIPQGLTSEHAGFTNLSSTDHPTLRQSGIWSEFLNRLLFVSNVESVIRYWC